MSESEQLTYSRALSELEEIIDNIESEEINVDILTEKVRRATFLIGFCRSRLKDTGDEVKKVLGGIEALPEQNDEGG